MTMTTLTTLTICFNRIIVLLLVFFLYKVLARRPNGVWAARFPIEYKVRICCKLEILQVHVSTRVHFVMCSRSDIVINVLKILDFRIFITKSSTSSS